jgi:hypothetical protein
VPTLCPECKAPIATADINVQTDVAICRACGNLTTASFLAGASPLPAPIDPARPPKGAWYRDDGV